MTAGGGGGNGGVVGDDGNTWQELGQLTQLLLVEGTKIVGAFAALHGLHHTDVEALSRVLVAEERGTPMTARAGHGVARGRAGPGRGVFRGQQTQTPKSAQPKAA